MWHEPGDAFPYAHDGATRNAAAGVVTATAGASAAAAATAGASMAGSPTMMEPSRSSIPPLRLISGGDHIVQTWTSGARAGRGDVELVLPDVPTVSREHARFTFSDGQWWAANLGMNGMMLNGVPVAGEQPVRDGDSIRWGMRGGALISRVEIG
jgi:pSer/pThr/pTyr-binding forkhead associated (FHA) protein